MCGVQKFCLYCVNVCGLVSTCIITKQSWQDAVCLVYQVLHLSLQVGHATFQTRYNPGTWLSMCSCVCSACCVCVCVYMCDKVNNSLGAVSVLFSQLAIPPPWEYQSHDTPIHHRHSAEHHPQTWSKAHEGNSHNICYCKRQQCKIIDTSNCSHFQCDDRVFITW